MSTPRSLGGGSALPVLHERAVVYQRRYADTLAVYVSYARDCAAAKGERARGEERLAKVRMDGAEKAVTTHTTWLREQHGPEVAREWIARARREAGLA